MADEDSSIAELQAMEQAFQNLSLQKQNFQLQLAEVESALEQIQNAEKVYKIVGGVMVLADRDAVKSDLESKKEILNLRISSIEKQEEAMKKKASELQKRVVENLNSHAHQHHK
ncbi:MAG: prefoldin subunit beta [Candidatus Woesearchaeota archaeon]